MTKNEGMKERKKIRQRETGEGRRKEVVKYGAAAVRKPQWGPLLGQIGRSWRCTKEGRTVLATGYFLNVGM